MQRERERERDVCARAVKARPRARASVLAESQRLNKVWKKVAKGVCNVAKLATPCISISPTTGWATGQTENMRCVNHALIKLVPLKWICVNALLTLTALLWIFIDYYGEWCQVDRSKMVDVSMYLKCSNRESIHIYEKQSLMRHLLSRMCTGIQERGDEDRNKQGI